MSQTPTKGLAIIALLERNPTASSTAIAKQLAAEHPDIFQDVENTRTLVRYYRGTQGKLGRTTLDPENYRPKIVIPDSEAKPYQPYIVDPNLFPLILTADWHMPYHDRDGLETMVEYAIRRKAKAMIVDGDALDFHQCSHYLKDPTLRDSVFEIETFRKTILAIQAAVGCKIIFKEGNHEARFDHYNMQQSPELYKFAQTRLRAILDLEKFGIDYVTSMQIMYYRQLTIIHGHEYVQSVNNPVSPARGLILRAKRPIAGAHHHRTSFHSATDIRGGQSGGWSVGCMCDLHPAYMPLNDWNLGFGDIDADDDMFVFENKRIIKNRVISA